MKKNEKRVVNNIGEDLHKIKGKATPANYYELFEKGEVDNKVRSGRGWLEVVIKCELAVLSKFHVHFTSFFVVVVVVIVFFIADFQHIFG